MSPVPASRLKIIFRISVSVLCLAFLGLKLDWHQLGGLFAAANWALIMAAWAISPLAIILLAWRLKLLLASQAMVIPFRSLLRLTWTAQFFNSFLPGSTGGDLFKLYEVTRLAPGTGAAGSAVVIVDRLLAFLALGLLALVGVALEAKPLIGLVRSGAIGVNRSIGLAAVGLMAAVILGFVLRHRISALGERPRRLVALAAQTVATARRTLRFNRYTVLSTAVAVGIHALSFFIVFLLGQALHIEITFLQVFEMMPVVMLVIALPVTINGHGLREVFMISYFELLHIHGVSGMATGGQVAVALSLAFVANDLLCSLPGGIWNLVAQPPPTTAAANPDPLAS